MVDNTYSIARELRQIEVFARMLSANQIIACYATTRDDEVIDVIHKTCIQYM
ncbi:hypothetical protein KMW28_27260 [Flammeovirga yaeyamensis]|uniref:Uncharacterized protein n=1 Tax=Flammeovirga yaeyamensis TaxID=367791 RepID=A0AAX1NAW3_9BACT|nr:hypothetical protein [Flammeovirga yaeyamensis]MBB3700019.1 hypothetical protein [Flammeovirga yaeyamensis]NMF37543.1 hypothetical protein [Flammeovirga yaeyamensis]QWG04600.1 hypothetical protein KMW28_27260 [Flammeovirga yaeyamensis]